MVFDGRIFLTICNWSHREFTHYTDRWIRYECYNTRLPLCNTVNNIFKKNHTPEIVDCQIFGVSLYVFHFSSVVMVLRYSHSLTLHTIISYTKSCPYTQTLIEYECFAHNNRNQVCIAVVGLSYYLAVVTDENVVAHQSWVFHTNK